MVKEIRDKFRDYSPAPPQDIWENIEEELDKKEKPVINWRWISFSAAAVVLLGVFLYFSLSSETTPQTQLFVFDHNPAGNLPSPKISDDQQDDQTDVIPADVNDSQQEVVVYQEQKKQQLNNEQLPIPQEDEKMEEEIVAVEFNSVETRKVELDPITDLSVSRTFNEPDLNVFSSIAQEDLREDSRAGEIMNGIGAMLDVDVAYENSTARETYTADLGFFKFRKTKTYDNND